MTDRQLIDSLKTGMANDYVIIPRLTLGTILDLASVCVQAQGELATRLFYEYLKEIEHRIVPYEKVDEVEYSVLVTGIDGSPKIIDMIKQIRHMTGLGLKEAKDVVDGFPKNVNYTFGKATTARKMLEWVSLVRSLGYHVVVYKGETVIFNSREDDDTSGLMMEIPAPIE